MAISPARLLIVPKRAATPRGFVPAPLPLRWPNMDPGAMLDFSMDVAQLLDDGDVVTTFSAAVDPDVPGGLEIDSLAIDSTTVTATLSGGVAGVDYAVTLDIATQGQRQLSLVVQLLVDRSASI